MLKLNFEKLYRYDRIEEPVYIGLPVKKGELTNLDKIALFQGNKKLPYQAKITSKHNDGSVRFLFLRFMPDIPANKGCEVNLDLDSSDTGVTVTQPKVVVESNSDSIAVDTGALKLAVASGSDSIFEYVSANGRTYDKSQFVGPVLKANNTDYAMKLNKWSIVESGPIAAILKVDGTNINGDINIDFELTLTAYAGKDYIELGYRIINTTDDELHVNSLVFYVQNEKGTAIEQAISPMQIAEILDSTGCGDVLKDAEKTAGPIYHERGITSIKAYDSADFINDVRTIAGSSNYKTDFYIGEKGTEVNRIVDAKYLLKEGNEHMPEVFYGTFFADCTDATGGVCGTIYQAQQNYPKAVRASKSGIAIHIVPEGVEKIVMQSGMSRETKWQLHFHKADETITMIDNRSLIYQMPDRPSVSPEYMKSTEVFPDIFPVKANIEVEQHLVAKADEHGKIYGMLNFGDSYDSGYTAQGRGGGEIVFCNNEYDYPHACALQYVRTGIRRFLDYNIASARHWMDVDVCHYSKDPLKVGGQWEHTNGHCKNGVMVCSHEWVEGLLDYYHFTGDERGLATAIGIGENVLRLLETPMYQVPGEANARETGWALRTLTALYVETSEDRWITKSEAILNDFKLWEDNYGCWIAPYTDNTLIRTGFMISVALGSLMRYYRQFPRDDIKELMIRAVDDLIENAFMESLGVFYYKELPSLARLGNNTLLLEALVIGYELTGDANYLKPGLITFWNQVKSNTAGAVGKKRVENDGVIVGDASSKGFGQSMIPVTTFYCACAKENLI